MSTNSTYHAEPAPTLDEVWRLFRENAIQMKETEQLLKENAKETERAMQKSSAETDRKIQETIEQMKKTDEQMRKTDEQMRKTDEQMRKTDEQMRKTDKKLNQLENLFTSQWGKLMESLVEGALIGIFNNWGLPVADTTTRLKGKYQGEPYEFDIIAHNGETVVIIEVKTTLRPKDVEWFIQKLDQIKTWVPRYANNHIYGAMAFLQADANAEVMVMKQRMFAIRATGDSAYIINPQGCELRTW